MSGTTSSAAYCRRIPLTVNSGKLSPVYPDDINEPITRKEELPTLFLGETAVFCLTFLDAAGNALAFAPDDVFEFNADRDYTHGNDPLMATATGPDAVNVAGDWSEADYAAGKLSIRVNCGTTGFAQKIAGAESCAIRLEVRRSSAGNTAYSVLMSTDGTARNTVRYDENAPGSADPGYYTATQTDVLLAGKAAATHTHTMSDITDMPTIPADVSDLTDTTGLLGSGGLQKWNGTWTNVMKSTTYTAATDGWLRIKRADDTGAGAQVNIEITDLGTTYTTIVLPAASYASARQVEFRYIFSGQTYKWTGGTGVDNDAEVYFSPVAI